MIEIGTWNETCMGTNLPLLEGRPCLAVVIAGTDRANNIYCTNSWTPLLVAYGNHDGYGRLEDVEDEAALERLLLHLPALSCRKQGGKIRPYVPKGFSKFTEDANGGLLVAAMGERADGRNRRYSPVRVVFLDPRFPELAEKDPDTKSLLATDVRPLLKSAHARAQEWKRGAEALMGTLREEDRAELEANLQRIARDVGHECDALTSRIARGWAPALSEFLKDAFLCEPTYARRSAEYLAEATLVLDRLRKAWHVPSGGGSQSDVCHMHNLFQVLYGDICDELDSPEDEWDE